MALNVVGYMGNNVLPARGGEVLRVGLLETRSASARGRSSGPSSRSERRRCRAGGVVLHAHVVRSRGEPQRAGAGPDRCSSHACRDSHARGIHRCSAAWPFQRFAARIRPLARGARGMVQPAGRRSRSRIASHLGAPSCRIPLHRPLGRSRPRTAGGDGHSRAGLDPGAGRLRHPAMRARSTRGSDWAWPR